MIREPAVAGQFYSAEPKRLRKSLDSYLRVSETLLDAKAIVAPHAGFMYSGPIAGAVYGAVKLPRRFVVLGPNHTGRGAPLGLSPAGEWRLPFGSVAIDADLNRRLLEEDPALREDRAAHSQEHSLEVQLPFLQAIVPDFRFSAICVGTSDYSSLEALGHALARVVRNWPEPVLLIASSDMTHYESAELAREKDSAAIERVLAVDPSGLYRVVHEKKISMCGYAPTVSVLVACQDLGPSEGRLIRYGNSGEISGDYHFVVGYAGLAIL